MTKREQIMQALVAALEAGVTAVSGRIYRSRTEALIREESPSLMVAWDTESPLEIVSGGTDKKLGVEIIVYQRGYEPDVLADAVVESVHAAVMADTSLGGLTIDIEEGETSLELDDSDTPTALVNMRYLIWYRHSRNTLGA